MKKEKEKDFVTFEECEEESNPKGFEPAKWNAENSFLMYRDNEEISRHFMKMRRFRMPENAPFFQLLLWILLARW